MKSSILFLFIFLAFAGSSEAAMLPVPVPMKEIQKVVAGDYHTCALMTSGRVMCWGANNVGQLGDGTTTGHAMPLPVVGISDAVMLGAGSNHTCALTAASGARERKRVPR